MKHPGGRPTKYKPYFCKLLIEYFDIPITKEILKQASFKTGKPEFTLEEVASDFPTLAGFAASIDVDDDTLVEWAKVHPEFSASIKKAKALQQKILVINAMANRYAQPFAIFFAKNNLGWSDKTETDITSKGKAVSVGVLTHKNNE